MGGDRMIQKCERCGRKYHVLAERDEGLCLECFFDKLVVAGIAREDNTDMIELQEAKDSGQLVSEESGEDDTDDRHRADYCTSMTFELNTVENDNLDRFLKRHKKCYFETAIGGQFRYMFTPTSLGNVVRVYCCICKKEEDITDYDAW
jgi:hypothetical protein